MNSNDKKQNESDALKRCKKLKKRKHEEILRNNRNEK